MIRTQILLQESLKYCAKTQLKNNINIIRLCQHHAWWEPEACDWHYKVRYTRLTLRSEQEENSQCGRKAAPENHHSQKQYSGGNQRSWLCPIRLNLLPRWFFSPPCVSWARLDAGELVWFHQSQTSQLKHALDFLELQYSWAIRKHWIIDQAKLVVQPT